MILTGLNTTGGGKCKPKAWGNPWKGPISNKGPALKTSPMANDDNRSLYNMGNGKVFIPIIEH